jgi:hypothetical protein
MEEEIDNLDTSWIEKFKKVENNYNIFYEEEVSNIKIYILYIDSNKTLQKIKQDNILLEKGILYKEYLLSYITKFQTDNDIQFKLLNILKYNISLESEYIEHFLKNNTQDNTQDITQDITQNEYLSVIHNLDNIYFKKTINIFQDLNCLYFIFHQLPKKLKSSNTKKVYIKHTKRKTKKRRLKIL